ncbi:MAG: glycosyltransferase [Candidatus Aenigmatarchaeota archaeon]
MIKCGENRVKKYISVIVIAYNRKDFILDALKSAVNQTLDRKFYEIIVIKNFNDNEIDNYILENNIKEINMDGGIESFFNAAIVESHGNIISFLDDDDLFTKDKLEYIYNNFTDKVAYIHNNYIAINKNGSEIDFMNKAIDFNMSCISIRKDIINKNFSKITIMPDTFLYLSAIGNGKIIKTKKVLTYYRIHDNNLSIPNSREEWKKNTERMLIASKQFYNFFGGRSQRLIANKITYLSLDLYFLGEDIKVKGIINFLFTPYPYTYKTWYKKLMRVAAFVIYRFKFGKKIVNKRLDAYLESLNRMRKIN